MSRWGLVVVGLSVALSGARVQTASVRPDVHASGRSGALRAIQPVLQDVGGSSQPTRALLDRYCVTCHNSRARTAGLSLETLTFDDPSVAPTWEKVVRKVRSG